MKPIQVTQAFLPPLEEYTECLKDIWASRHLTNNGPYLSIFEDEVRGILNTRNAMCVSNGTIAIQLAIRAFRLRGKIITTPFSYVATTSSVLWEHCEPIFADISPRDLNIDPLKVEALIDKDTVAILAVHVYGHVCDVEALQEIANRHGLKLIYDAAHAFGVEYKNKPISHYGDATTFSLHATKLVHSIEGGIVVAQSPEIYQELYYLRAFGHTKDEHKTLGINAKLSEVHAAMGHCVLKYFPQIITNRRRIYEFYKSELSSMPVEIPEHREHTRPNYSYFPVLFDSTARCEKVYQTLQELSIFTRKYFYPSLNTLPYVKYQSCPVSESVSQRVLCLPLYADLGDDEAAHVTESLRKTLRSL